MKIAQFFRKVPAGNILIPMFLSALIHTIDPNVFRIGGITQALLAGEGLNFMIGVACFCSGLLLDLNTLKQVLAKQGLLLLAKIIIAGLIGFVYFSLFKEPGILGVSLLALVVLLFAVNPAIYLSIVTGKGSQQDLAAFGLVGLMSLPVVPMIFFGLLSNKGSLDMMPVISTLIPIIIGMVLGNLDPEVRKFFSPLLSVIMPLMGWALGVSLNLLTAFKSGLSGLLLAVLFYGLMMIPLYLVETKLLKHNGVSAVAMSSLPGLSISFPAILGAIYPGLAPYVRAASAQLAFAVILTSILTPIIANKLADRLEAEDTALA